MIVDLLTARQRTLLKEAFHPSTVAWIKLLLSEGEATQGTGGTPPVTGVATTNDYTTADKNKLAGIAAGATVNSTDAQLRDRATHTGVQTSASISDFTEAVQDAVAALLGAGSNITLSYNDAAGTLSVTAAGASGGGVTDPEAVRDAIGIAMSGVGNISVAVNDAADTITITTTATANSTDAQLRDRATHTGVQAATTVTEDPTHRFFTDTERTKLGGVSAGATANAADASLRDRGTHTGTQLATSISDLTETVQDIVGAFVVAGANVTKTYDDTGNTLTIAATGGGGGGAAVTGTGNANVVGVTTATVAAVQSAINAATTGTTVRLDFAELPFGNAEALNVVNKTGLILDLNGAALTGSQTRTMIYFNGTLNKCRLTNGRIINNSPTLPYNSQYGYFATITSNEDAQFNGLEIDHIEGTTPNADQDFMLFVCYRDVQGNNGGTALLRNVNIHHNRLRNIGRMGVEFINGGSKYGDFTERYVDCSFNDNYAENLGLVSPENYGMAISWDGMHSGAVTARNQIRNARTAGVEIVNGRNCTVDANTIIDDLTQNGSAFSGCVGFSITNNKQFANTTTGIGTRTRNIRLTGNITDVRQRPIQAYQVDNLGLVNNEFMGVKGSDFILKRASIVGNQFHATLPTEPVVTFHPSGDDGKFWCSNYNTFNSNMVTNALIAAKPTGYAGPYELLKFDGGADYNSVVGNMLVMDPSVNTGQFGYIAFANNTTESTFVRSNNLETVYNRPGFAP